MGGVYCLFVVFGQSGVCCVLFLSDVKGAHAGMRISR